MIYSLNNSDQKDERKKGHKNLASGYKEPRKNNPRKWLIRQIFPSHYSLIPILPITQIYQGGETSPLTTPATTTPAVVVAAAPGCGKLQAMSMPRMSLRVGASVAVVLATVVQAAAADGRVLAAESPAPDLSWALAGGAALSVRSARVYLARQAVTAIHSWDWLTGAAPAASLAALNAPALVSQAFAGPLFLSPAQQPARGTCQHSAP